MRRKPAVTASVKALCARETWELPKGESRIAPPETWTNRDMEPTLRKDQTWSVWTIMSYWASDLIALSVWETASSILAVGLSWREAIPIMFIGTFIVAIPIVLNGAIGTKLHVPFSVYASASFGVYLRYFCIVARCVLALFWLGVQTANGAYCVTIMLRAWAPSYADIHNSLPASAGITTMGMVSYLVFWVIQFPFLLIHPTKLRWVFAVKLITAPIVSVGTLIWCVVKAKHISGGVGDIFSQRATVQGSEYAYLYLSCMSSVIGSWCTLAVNMPDFTRYCADPRGQYAQLPFLPLVFGICGVLGIVTTSAAHVFTGEYMWNPLDIIALWLEDGNGNSSAGGRAAAFFAALAWMVAQIGCNITANCISAANDLTVLCPRWINIRRGCAISAVVSGWALVPWEILASADTLLAFLGGYAVFLGPMAGIMTADYWLVKRTHVDIPALYDPRGRYRYRVFGKDSYGCNWVAAVAFLVPVAPLLPGLANSITPGSVAISAGLQHLFSFNWLFGYVTATFLYTVLSYVFPDKNTLLEETIWGPEEEEETDLAIVGLETCRSSSSRNGNMGDLERGNDSVGGKEAAATTTKEG